MAHGAAKTALSGVCFSLGVGGGRFNTFDFHCCTVGNMNTSQTQGPPSHRLVSCASGSSPGLIRATSGVKYFFSAAHPHFGSTAEWSPWQSEPRQLLDIWGRFDSGAGRMCQATYSAPAKGRELRGRLEFRQLWLLWPANRKAGVQ